MATQAEVLAAYAANPKAEVNPSQEAINFWMNNDLGQFNSMVDAVRAANPALASLIDRDRSVVGTQTDMQNNNTISNVINTIAGGSNVNTASSTSPYLKMITDAYGTLGRSGVGTGANQIDQGGLNYWLGEVESGRLSPADFNKTFYKTVGNYYAEKPTDAITKYTSPILQENAYKDLLSKAYGGIGRTGFGTDVKNIDQGGWDFWLNAMKSGQYNTDGKFDVNKFLTNFNTAVDKYKTEFPNSELTKYVSQYAPVKVNTDLLVNGIGGTPPTQTATVGQFRELFPSFGESKRLAGEMVANRPSMNSIIAMLQGQGQQMPTQLQTQIQPQIPMGMPVEGQTPTLSNVLNMISK